VPSLRSESLKFNKQRQAEIRRGIFGMPDLGKDRNTFPSGAMGPVLTMKAEKQMKNLV
jgi:hypothetical protein